MSEAGSPLLGMCLMSQRFLVLPYVKGGTSLVFGILYFCFLIFCLYIGFLVNENLDSGSGWLKFFFDDLVFSKMFFTVPS